jgi:hypothetical protein
MTPDEHQMLILVLASQRKAIAAIWEAMKSNDLVLPNDIPAFEFAASQADIGTSEHFRTAIADYWKAAKVCNVALPPGIEAIGQTASEWNSQSPDL